MTLENDPSQSAVAIRAQLLEKRVIVLEGVICDELAGGIIAKMLFLQSQSRQKPITLLIDSVGGAVTSGMAIVDAIRELEPAVQTCCIGSAYAMAAIILVSGVLGGRGAVRTAKIGFRNPDSLVRTSEEDRERIHRLLIERTSEMTSVSRAALEDLFASGKDLSAPEALNLGMVDLIVEVDVFRLHDRC
jgi:ATP-dependent Clp protease protease subunit